MNGTEVEPPRTFHPEFPRGRPRIGDIKMQRTNTSALFSLISALSDQKDWIQMGLVEHCL